MLRNPKHRNLKTYVIAISFFLLAFGGKPERDTKIFGIESFNPENKPGLIRRETDTGKIIEHITFDEAHELYGAMTWGQVDDIWDELEECKGKVDMIREETLSDLFLFKDLGDK